MQLRKTKNFTVINDLHIICFPDDHIHNKSQYDPPDLHWWIMWDKGKPIGFCGMDGPFLCRAGVIPEYQGQGLHKKLIAVREKYGVQKGMDYIYTYVVYSNVKSLNALCTAGFRSFIPETGVERDLVYMRKRLIRPKLKKT